jgi:hypothetical protein
VAFEELGALLALFGFASEISWHGSGGQQAKWNVMDRQGRDDWRFAGVPGIYEWNA